jgi:hypothetical protein
MRRVLSLVFTGALLMSVRPLQAEDFGKFSGKPKTEWNDDGRTMKLLEDFTYTDPKSEKWIAPAGSSIDGASIPRMFWWLIGGPFEGEYRNASVVHDTECHEPHKHDWRAVHRMFYSASRAGGTDFVKAKIMFAAVYHFGPRWNWPNSESLPYSLTSNDDALRLVVVIRKNPDISLEAIEGLSHAALVAQVSDEEVEQQREHVEYMQRKRTEGQVGGHMFF